MISITQARQIVESHLAPLSRELEPDAVVIMDSATTESAFGWVFSYQSREYLQSGNASHRLTGNAQLIVNRFTGEVVETGTAHPIEHYLAEYGASLDRSAP